MKRPRTLSLAERTHAQRRDDGAVDAAGETDDGAALAEGTEDLLAKLLLDRSRDERGVDREHFSRKHRCLPFPGAL